MDRTLETQKPQSRIKLAYPQAASISRHQVASEPFDPFILSYLSRNQLIESILDPETQLPQPIMPAARWDASI